MLSKQQLGFIRSLHQKKFRQMYGKFLVEGDKLVRELMASEFKIDAIYKTASWNGAIQRGKIDVIEVSDEELRKISTHETPNEVLAVAQMPQQLLNIENNLAPSLYLVCDTLNDPGNAGTIIRTADWFGISTIFFSHNSVDIFNPKVVSAAKGSLFRVNCCYANLEQLFTGNKHLPVYGTFMQGQNIYQLEPVPAAFILIGNEANGISETLNNYVNHRISIPNFGKAESLNAAVATAIVLSEFKRLSNK